MFNVKSSANHIPSSLNLPGFRKTSKARFIAASSVSIESDNGNDRNDINSELTG